MSEKNLSIFKSVAVSAVVEWQLSWDEKYAGKPAQMYDDARKYVAEHTVDEIVEGRDGFWGTGQDSLTSIVTGIRILGEKMGMPELSEWSDADIERMLREEDPKLGEALERAGSQYKGDLSKDIVDTLEQIHDKWAADPKNIEKFDVVDKKGNERDKKYQYLPLEFMGWKEAHLDLLFLQPVIQASGCEVDMKAIREEFENREAQLVHDLVKNGVEKALKNYAPIQGTRIPEEVMRRGLADHITAQVAERAGAMGSKHNREMAFQYAQEELKKFKEKFERDNARESALKILGFMRSQNFKELAINVLNGLTDAQIASYSLGEKVEMGIMGLDKIMSPRNDEPGFRSQEELNIFKESLSRLGVDEAVFVYNPELLKEKSDLSLQACALMVASRCGTFEEANAFYGGITEKGLNEWLEDQKVNSKDRDAQERSGEEDPGFSQAD